MVVVVMAMVMSGIRGESGVECKGRKDDGSTSMYAHVFYR
jgi:hypothetical protein